MSYTIGGERNVLLNHPDHAQHVLGSNRTNYCKDTGANCYFRTEVADGILTADGERWRRHRTLLTPAFRDRQRLIATARESIAALVSGVRHRRRHRSRGESVRRDRRGDPVDYHPGPVRYRPRTVHRGVHGGRPRPRRSQFTTAWRRAGAGPRDALYRQLRNAISALATERHGPALSALINDPEHAGEALYQQLVTLLLAGYETTANSLTWAWILLMQHPDIYAEWQHTLDTDPDHATELTKALFDETLRLYPSAWVLGRRALADDRVGKVAIPAGSAVTISPFLLHRHPQFWDEPETFRPHRFLARGVRPTHRYAYIPFGAGHRYCIGSSYAHDEAAMILTALGRRFTFRSTHAADARPEHKFVLRAPDPSPVTVYRRS